MPSQFPDGGPRRLVRLLTAAAEDVAACLRRPLVGASLLLTALTVMLTWPQVLHLGTYVSPYPDPRLSIWRLSWLAHALKGGDLTHLFDGNIFYPSPGTFAFSDATFLEGLIAAPWLWAHVNAVAVYNILLLAGIVTSGIGMFILVRDLTGDLDAALVSATIFTLVPYRVEHFMHLELQWTIWMPLSMWGVHRAFDRGSVRSGLWAGLWLALQVLSCVYYGVFLGMIVAALAVLLAMARPDRALRGMRALAVGAIIPAVVIAVYSQPYLANAKTLGPRARWDIELFSAHAASYISAPQENWLWGWTAWGFSGNELHLFPGAIAIGLAATALVLRPSRLVWIYLAIVGLAAELSLGLNGPLYRWLYLHVSPFSGFRAPARFSILACCGLAVLGGFGFQALQRRSPGFSPAGPCSLITLVALGLEFGLGADAPRTHFDGRAGRIQVPAHAISVGPRRTAIRGLGVGAGLHVLVDVPLESPGQRLQRLPTAFLHGNDGAHAHVPGRAVGRPSQRARRPLRRLARVLFQGERIHAPDDGHRGEVRPDSGRPVQGSGRLDAESSS